MYIRQLYTYSPSAPLTESLIHLKISPVDIRPDFLYGLDIWVTNIGLSTLPSLNSTVTLSVIRSDIKFAGYPVIECPLHILWQ